MYYIEKDEKKKNKRSFILIRVILPAFTTALVSFAVIKFRNNNIFTNEPLMKGEFFDS